MLFSTVGEVVLVNAAQFSAKPARVLARAHTAMHSGAFPAPLDGRGSHAAHMTMGNAVITQGRRD